MTTDIKIAKIEELLRKYEAVMVSLNAFVELSGGTMDSPFADPICRLLDAHVDAVAELVGDEEEWISWYVAENNYGQKKPGVVLPDGRHITVDSVERLVEVMQTAQTDPDPSEAVELCEVFLKHHTGKRKLSDREICAACYNAGRVLGKHTNPKSSVYDSYSPPQSHERWYDSDGFVETEKENL